MHISAIPPGAMAKINVGVGKPHVAATAHAEHAAAAIVVATLARTPKT
jgi:hypothetical protein